MCLYTNFVHHNIRILFGQYAIHEKGDQRATTVMQDLLLTRAECGQQLVLDRMERISSLSKVSTRKHDRTHRKWFNDNRIVSTYVRISCSKKDICVHEGR